MASFKELNSMIHARTLILLGYIDFHKVECSSLPNGEAAERWVKRDFTVNPPEDSEDQSPASGHPSLERHIVYLKEA